MSSVEEIQEYCEAERKPVICEVCGAVFEQQAELSNHKKKECKSRKRDNSNFASRSNYTFISKRIKVKDENDAKSESSQSRDLYGNTADGLCSSDDLNLELIVSDRISSDSSEHSDFEDNFQMLKTNRKMVESETAVCCPSCGKMCPNEVSLQRHQKMHNSGASFVCEICGSLYKYKKSYTTHMEMHKKCAGTIKINSKAKHGKKNESFQDEINSNKHCFTTGEFCGATVNNQEEYVAHFFDIHNTDYLSNQPQTSGCTERGTRKTYSRSKIFTSFLAKDVGSGPYRCEFCAVTFKYSCLLKTHICRKRFLCKICGLSYKTKEVLEQHEQTHKIESSKEFACQDCGEVFTNRVQFEEHQIAHITAVTCEGCGRRFPKQSFLNVHQEKTSGKTSPSFPCDQCNEVFVCHNARQIHKSTHDTGCFKCTLCGRMFNQSKYLKVHLCMVHKLFANPQYSCDQCDRIFLRKEALVVHELTHAKRKTDEQKNSAKNCNNCGIEIKNSMMHVSLTNDKWFCSDECQKTFRYKVSYSKVTKAKQVKDE